jgi:hypothetical protein
MRTKVSNVWKGVTLDNQFVFGVYDLLVVFAGGHSEVVAAVERAVEIHLRSAESLLSEERSWCEVSCIFPWS